MNTTTVDITERVSRRSGNNSNQSSNRLEKTPIAGKNKTAKQSKLKKITPNKGGTVKSKKSADNVEHNVIARVDAVQPVDCEQIMQTEDYDSSNLSVDADEPGHDCPNQFFDGVDVNIVGDNEFTNDGEEEEVVIRPRRKDDDEEIPPEVIEKLKTHPVMKKFVDDVVEAKLPAREEEVHRKRSIEKTRDETSGDRKGLAGKEGGTSNEQMERLENYTPSRLKSPSDTTIYEQALK